MKGFLANNKIIVIILALVVAGGIVTGVLLFGESDKNDLGKGVSVPSSDEAMGDEVFEGKVTEKSDNVLMAFYDADTDEYSPKLFSNWAYEATIVEFEKSYSDDLKVTDSVDDIACDNGYALDVSESGNGSVVAYLTKNGEDVTLHISGKDGVVMANKNSACVFWSYRTTTSEYKESLIKEIKFNGAFNTCNAETMEEMFYACRQLESINLSGFDTSNVKNMKAMFELCINLQELDVSSFDTSNVETFEGMFDTCKSLIKLDLTSFNTAKATNMSNMIGQCFLLESVDVSSFDTSAVTNMYGMFNECKALKSLDVSNFDTSNVVDMDFVFGYCESLETLDLSNFNTSNVTTMKSMFLSCTNLKSLNVSSFDVSNVTAVGNMFNSCGALETLDLSSFDPVKLTESEYGLSNRRSVFEGCNKAKITFKGKVYQYGVIPDLYQLEDDFFGVVD